MADGGWWRLLELTVAEQRSHLERAGRLASKAESIDEQRRQPSCDGVEREGRSKSAKSALFSPRSRHEARYHPVTNVERLGAAGWGRPPPFVLGWGVEGFVRARWLYFRRKTANFFLLWWGFLADSCAPLLGYE